MSGDDSAMGDDSTLGGADTNPNMDADESEDEVGGLQDKQMNDSEQESTTGCPTENPCLNGGICQGGDGSYLCLCDETGFTGEHCEIDIDECATNNGGCAAECANSDGGYSCVCGAGLEGSDCESDIDGCAGENCSDHGTCVDARSQERRDS